MRTPWSPKDLARLDRYIRQKMTIGKIAKLLNKPYSSVHFKIVSINSKKIVKYKKQDDLLDLILRIVSEYFDLQPSSVIQKNKAEEIRIPRQICHYLSKKYTKFSNSYIGKYLGSLDPSTVSNGLKRVDEYIQTDKEFRMDFDTLDFEVKMAISDFKSDNTKEIDIEAEIRKSIVGVRNKIKFDNLLKKLKNE